MTHIFRRQKSRDSISTHTPARGVTFAWANAIMSAICISTHTPARGVTVTGGTLSFELNDFYSHAREGRDMGREEKHMNKFISTHTPARGVTFTSEGGDGQIIRFLLTRPRGA